VRRSALDSRFVVSRSENYRVKRPFFRCSFRLDFFHSQQVTEKMQGCNQIVTVMVIEGIALLISRSFFNRLTAAVFSGSGGRPQNTALYYERLRYSGEWMQPVFLLINSYERRHQASRMAVPNPQ